MVIDQSKFPLGQAVYFDTEKDGRMIFAIPREGKAYVVQLIRSTTMRKQHH